MYKFNFNGNQYVAYNDEIEAAILEATNDLTRYNDFMLMIINNYYQGNLLELLNYSKEYLIKICYNVIVQILKSNNWQELPLCYISTPEISLIEDIDFLTYVITTTVIESI